jgi:hypothetical protein
VTILTSPMRASREDGIYFRAMTFAISVNSSLTPASLAFESSLHSPSITQTNTIMVRQILDMVFLKARENKFVVEL